MAKDSIRYTEALREQLIEGYRNELWDDKTKAKFIAAAERLPLGEHDVTGIPTVDVDEDNLTDVQSVLLSLGYFGIEDLA